MIGNYKIIIFYCFDDSGILSVPRDVYYDCSEFAFVSGMRFRRKYVHTCHFLDLEYLNLKEKSLVKKKQLTIKIIMVLLKLTAFYLIRGIVFSTM